MEVPLSIVITTYNRQAELKRCIESIIKQNYTNYEIIVVDDHSPNSYEFEIKKEYPQIKYFYMEFNSGPGKGRNRGIEEASNNYVVIIDDDDVFIPIAFKKISHFIQSQKNIEDPVIHFLCNTTEYEGNTFFSHYSFEQYLEGNIKGDTTHVINKKVFCENNYEFPNSRIGAELLLWYQIAIDFL